MLERAGEIGARNRDEIEIQTLRGGDNPGKHTVMFVAKGERIELIHRSATRDHFASGAVRAAAWLIGRGGDSLLLGQVIRNLRVVLPIRIRSPSASPAPPETSLSFK